MFVFEQADCVSYFRADESLISHHSVCSVGKVPFHQSAFKVRENVLRFVEVLLQVHHCFL